MRYTIKYNGNATRAAEDMENYITDYASDLLAGDIVKGCNYKQMRFMAAFAGVQGYPVTCWMKETRELYATH